MSDTERRKPGRPSNAEVAARQHDPVVDAATAIGRQWSTPRDGFVQPTTTVAPAPTTEPARPTRSDEVQTRRRRREGLGAERNMKLHVPEEAKDPKYTYRFANDRAGRVKQLYSQDWDVVSTSELNGGDPDPAGNTAEGTVMKRTADSRIGESTVLMKKLREYYEADKREEARALDARDEALRKGPPASPQGLSSADNAYVPGGRNIVAGK